MKLAVAFVIFSLSGCATAQRGNNVEVFGYGGLRQASRVPSSAQQAKFAPPADSVFQDVGDYASKHNYFGNDLLVCMDGTNSKMKLGGTSHWGGTVQLFMDYAGGRIDMGKLSKEKDASDGPVQAYIGGSLTFTMTQKGGSQNLSYYTADVTDKSGHVSEVLLCYLRSSGLE